MTYSIVIQRLQALTPKIDENVANYFLKTKAKKLTQKKLITSEVKSFENWKIDENFYNSLDLCESISIKKFGWSVRAGFCWLVGFQ